MKPRFSGFSRNFTHLKEILLFGLSLIVYEYMAMSGHARPHTAMYGHTWPYMAIHGHIWPCMAIYGHVWPYMAVCGRACPDMAIYSYTINESPKSKISFRCVKLRENPENLGFTFFGFLPPYLGVSDSLAYFKRRGLKRSIV